MKNHLATWSHWWPLHPNRANCTAPWLGIIMRQTSQMAQSWHGIKYAQFSTWPVWPVKSCKMSVKKSANPGLFFVYFGPFLITISKIQIEKSVDGMLGIQTCSRMMIGADNTMELWRLPKNVCKSCPKMSVKLPKNDFTSKIKDFDTFTKVAYECGRFGQNNWCQRLWKVAQCPINRPIWSHCPHPRCRFWSISMDVYSLHFGKKSQPGNSSKLNQSFLFILA